MIIGTLNGPKSFMLCTDGQSVIMEASENEYCNCVPIYRKYSAMTPGGMSKDLSGFKMPAIKETYQSNPLD